MKMILLISLGTAALVFFGLTGCARATVEQPAFTLVHTLGKVEIRAYPDMKTAIAPMAGEGQRDQSFRMLFRYIQGDNAANRKIAMTSPVLIDRADSKTMAFIVPADVAKGEVPAPRREEVKLGSIAGGQFAALRFPGAQDAEREKDALARLRGELDKAGLESVGAPVFAYYDPPWTPIPMRRNEVLLRLKQPFDPEGEKAAGR